MNNLKLTPDLLIFTEVAKHLSFTHAAKKLGISKAAVSISVSRLENQLNTQLLIRNTRSMKLTPIGEKLVARGEILNAHIKDTINELHTEQSIPSGPFSITAPSSLESNIIMPTLRQLCTEFPKVVPQLHITDKPLDLLTKKLDVAVYSGTLPDSDYRALPLSPLTEKLFAAPGYLEQHKYSDSIGDLENLNWAKASWQNEMIKLFNIKEKETLHLISPKTVSNCNSLGTAIEMAVNSLGFVFSPFPAVAHHILSGKLTHITQDFSGKEWPLFFLHAYKNTKPLHIQRFYELLHFHMRQTEGY